jgi:hypothetical protein
VDCLVGHALYAKGDRLLVIAKDRFPVDDKRNVNASLSGGAGVEAAQIHYGVSTASTTEPGSTASIQARRITSLAPP